MDGWHWAATTVEIYPTTCCCCCWPLDGDGVDDGVGPLWKIFFFAFASTTHDIPCKRFPATSVHI